VSLGLRLPRRDDARDRGRARFEAVVYVVVGLAFAAFVASAVPGVRIHPGYNLYLDGWLNNVCYMLAPAVCWMRARNSASYRASWRMLTLGLTLYGLGNIYWTIFIRPLDPEPFPSIADGLWLAFYPCAFAALILLLRERAQRMPASLWLDGIVGGLAAAAVAAAAIIGPIMAANSGTIAAVVTTTAYPMLDLVVLFVLIAVLALFHWHPPRGMWFFSVGLGLFVVADAIYLVSTAHDTYQPGGINDAVWVLATLLMGFAPGWPDRPAGRRLPAWALLGVPVVSALAALGLLVHASRRGHSLHPIAVALATATVVAALMRLVVTFREATVLAHNRELAVTDELTGLGNRRAFYDAAARWLESGTGEHGALLLLDLDRFKEVNDSLGHHAGDDLLEQVARRLDSAVHGENDTIARLGGDEFAVLARGVTREEAELVAARIRATVAPPYNLEGVTVRIDVSIGIALAPDHGLEASSLLRKADIAMYQAKASRVGQFVYNVESDASSGQDRLRTLEELRTALMQHQLTLHYQPKVNATTRHVSGVEALVRWNHPTRGLLFPDAFLHLVEDAGLMRELTIAVLTQALDQVLVWREQGRELSIAVNLSPSSLVDVDLPARIFTMLRDRRLPPGVLELEITEDSLMNDRERARDVLSTLRRLGIRVAVDDFGTGYSSLSYLRELPIDELKLDRSFVGAMAEDPRSAAIVRSTIGLAHSLGLQLVAEGVEDAATAKELAQSGCDEAQGFFYSKPLPPEQLEAWLDSHSRSPSRALTDVID
jgi:diguanylate cyclase (GGDEF)-like protein